jgi:F1F0 ATPase subunit 2
MSEVLTWMAACLGGMALGTIFFGGLWWTIVQSVSSRHPALLFIVSLFARTGIALAGFYFVSQGRWQRLIACLAGFLCARIAITLLTRREPRHESYL